MSVLLMVLAAINAVFAGANIADGQLGLGFFNLFAAVICTGSFFLHPDVRR